MPEHITKELCFSLGNLYIVKPMTFEREGLDSIVDINGKVNVKTWGLTRAGLKLQQL